MSTCKLGQQRVARKSLVLCNTRVVARGTVQDASTQSVKNRLGAPFKSMVYGMRDFDTCAEFKDGGLAPDDPFHKTKVTAPLAQPRLTPRYEHGGASLALMCARNQLQTLV